MLQYFEILEMAKSGVVTVPSQKSPTTIINVIAPRLILKLTLVTKKVLLSTGMKLQNKT